MKISLEWLGEFVEGPLDAPAVADALTNGGLNVEKVENVGADSVLDVEVTSNRGDCLCHVGVAREVAALLGRKFQEPAPAQEPAGEPGVGVSITAGDLCPHYTARVLRAVKVGPSPDWLRRRLEAVGVRSINNIVDVTNYVMFEMGQPLHAFDMARLAGPIVVRRANKGERLVTIDGKERTLAPDMLVIADAGKAVALAGVMGGRETEVGPATADVLLESARFDALAVRRTSRALTLESASSYRFERGIEPGLPLRASLRAAHLMARIAGGTIGSAAQAGGAASPPKQLTLRLARLRALLGIDVGGAEAVAALARLGFAPREGNGVIAVTVPGHRLDVTIEADLIEEVARIIGYGRIGVEEKIAIRLCPPPPQARVLQTLRSVLAGGGYFEAVTFSFVSDALKDAFATGPLPRADALARKADAHLRPSILPGLLEALARNENVGNTGVKLFEIGAVFGLAGTKIAERVELGVAGAADVREARGMVEALLSRLDDRRVVRVEPADHPGYARGAGGKIFWGAEAVGRLGLIDAAAAEKAGLRKAPAAAELDMSALLDGAEAQPQQQPLPRFPAVRRDLSLIVADAVRYEQVQAAIASVGARDLEAVEYVTAYRGKPLENGTRSVTVTLVFRAADGTLTGEEVDERVRRIVTAAQDQIGARLRS